MSIGTSKTEKQRERRIKTTTTTKIPEYPRTVGHLQRYNICTTGISKGQRERNRKNMWSSNDQEISKINAEPNLPSPGSLKNTKQLECQKIYTCAFHLQTAENQRKNSYNTM